MGSKVSSKMAAPTAAAANRVIQAVRPHTPLIKFPNRLSVQKPDVTEALKIFSVSPQPNLPSSAPPIAGTPDTLASIQLFPARYRRRPLSIEEMDYIQRGGPE